MTTIKIQTDPAILIESAQVITPKRGTTDQIRVSRDALRVSNPEFAASIEAEPFCVDPDSPTEGDDFAGLHLTYLINDNVSMCWRTQIPLSDLPQYRAVAVSPVEVQSDPEMWEEYAFHVDATFAFGLLKHLGIIRADSTLRNERVPGLNVSLPWDYQGELEDEMETSEAADILCKEMEGM